MGFSLGCAIDAAVREAAEVLTATQGWYSAITADGGIREGAWVAEATDLVDLSKWPPGTRLILPRNALIPVPAHVRRRLRTPHHRVSHRTRDGVVPGQLAGLELHRQHARVEDRIRQAKATGLRKLLFHSFQAAPGSKSSWPQQI